MVCDADAVSLAEAEDVGASALLHRGWPIDRVVSVVHQAALDGDRRSGIESTLSSDVRLSGWELAILQMVATGPSNPEIALALHLSSHGEGLHPDGVPQARSPQPGGSRHPGGTARLRL